MPTVLVTGGCGFIGLNLGRLLRAQGWRAVALDNLSEGRKDDGLQAGYERVIEADVRDEEAVRQALGGVDHVVHLAAQTGVTESLADPRHDLDVNVNGTMNTLLAARDADVRGFVFASSNAPLGEVEPPSHEGIAPRPLSPYGASKLAGEALCSAFSASYGVPTTVLRFSNVYGTHSWRKGSVVAAFFRRILRDEPLIVYGDGSQTRDFVYADDLCEAILLALESELRGEVFHIGTGVETAINELVRMIAGHFPERDVEVRHEPQRPGEIQRNYSDISKARSVLGFAPATSLDDGLVMTRDWFLRAR